MICLRKKTIRKAPMRMVKSWSRKSLQSPCPPILHLACQAPPHLWLMPYLRPTMQMFFLFEMCQPLIYCSLMRTNLTRSRLTRIYSLMENHEHSNEMMYHAYCSSSIYLYRGCTLTSIYHSSHTMLFLLLCSISLVTQVRHSRSFTHSHMSLSPLSLLASVLSQYFKFSWSALLTMSHIPSPR